MEEIFSELIAICFNSEIISLTQACEILGANLDKIKEYCLTDYEMSCQLTLCANLCRYHVLENFYYGELSRKDAELFLTELDSIITIYTKIPLGESQ